MGAAGRRFVERWASPAAVAAAYEALFVELRAARRSGRCAVPVGRARQVTSSAMGKGILGQQGRSRRRVGRRQAGPQAAQSRVSRWPSSLIVVGGLLLVVFARRATRRPPPTTRRRGPARPTNQSDHWHAAFASTSAARTAPGAGRADDKLGIHTHGDGVIHIHPFVTPGGRQGRQARAVLRSGRVACHRLRDPRCPTRRSTAKAQTTCNGKPAQVEVGFWKVAVEVLRREAGQDLHEQLPQHPLHRELPGLHPGVPPEGGAAQRSELVTEPPGTRRGGRERRRHIDQPRQAAGPAEPDPAADLSRVADRPTDHGQVDRYEHHQARRQHHGGTSTP